MLRICARLSAGLLALWLLCLAAAYNISTRPAGDEAHLLPGEVLCALPCWAGLRVGERIDTEEAAATLRSVLPEPRYIQFYADGSFYFTAGREEAYLEGSALIRYDTADTLWGLELRREILLSTLLERLRAPACYTPVPSPLGQQSIGVVLHWRVGDLSLSSILLGDPAQTLLRNQMIQDLRITTDDACAPLDARSWFGFAPLWAY